MALLFRNVTGKKTPSLITTFLFITLILTSLLITPLQANNNGSATTNPTAYELLEGYGFPRGLLPKGVLGFDLDKSTGKFSVYLNGSCSFSLEGSYQLKYKSTIKGSISDGKLQNLQGVSVKVLLFWVNIVEILRFGNDLEFSVGIASASFPIDNFEECPQCGCGICGFKQVSNIRTNPFLVSS
ncbi:pectinesterase (Protein of unknown function, DUF538) [Thalictrum thalictroides]|uniref:Uncharacterized protein n=1 Tax=Thalictrum thalictroides TaxID=46969 RepID=A0A7J6WHM2_THATH|nr:pectinesterase (Protein of unknown function, DUF538) [Thalictrum thalictroides]